MSTLAARFPRVGALARAERLSGILPLVTIYVWLCLLYGWEAWGNLTPWLFTDELEHAQLSRAIADTGQAARRGVAHSPDSLYSYLIAPAWWIGDTNAAYGLVKAIGVVVMTAAIFPTYALARILVSRPAALMAATTAVAVPALAYSSLILQEPVAYTWSMLCVWLIVRALVTPTRSWIAGAVVASLAAPLVRGELVVIPAAFLLAYGLWWFTGEAGRAWRRGWSVWDWTGFVVLAAGAVIVFNGFASSRSFEWLQATQHYKGRMVDYGLWAGGALTIGLGVLPVIAGLAALFPGRWSTRPSAERAFLCVAAAAVFGFGYYTAIKAAYISTVFSTLVVERNLIYAAPILLVATALFFERRRAHPLAIAGAATLALYMLVTTPYKMEFHFYADAPGLSILQSANRVLAFTPDDAEIGLLVVLVVSVAIVIAVAAMRTRWVPFVALAAGALVLAWNLTGEITGARSSHLFADELLTNFPRPLDWVDRSTGGEPTVYYGQRVNVDPNGVWLLEFWNRSVQGLWTLDGSGVGPGLTVTPDVLKPNGSIRVSREFKYAVADEGVNLVGRVIARKTHLAGGRPTTWNLYELTPPMRLRNNVEDIYPDGWAGERSAYSQFSTPEQRRGFLVVTATRTGGGKTLPANVRLVVGKLVIGPDTQPAMGEQLLERTVHVESDLDRQFVLDAPQAPFRAEVQVWPTFRPHDLDPNNSDIRNLGAQVSYQFVPRLPRAVPGKPPELEGVFPDGWIGSEASYTQWAERGSIRLTLSRPAGPSGATVLVRVGRLAYSMEGGSLKLGVRRATVERTVRLRLRGGERTVTLASPPPPFRLELRASPTFVPAKVVPGSTDTRTLGARVSLEFTGSR